MHFSLVFPGFFFFFVLFRNVSFWTFRYTKKEQLEHPAKHLLLKSGANRF